VEAVCQDGAYNVFISNSIDETVVGKNEINAADKRKLE